MNFNELEELKTIYKDNSDWLKFNEAKSIFTLGIMITIAYKMFDKSYFQDLTCCKIIIIIGIIGPILYLLAGILSLKDILSSNIQVKKINHLYFKDISSMSRETFLDLNYTEEIIRRDYKNQIYDIAVIATKKLNDLKYASLIFLLFLIMYLFII